MRRAPWLIAAAALAVLAAPGPGAAFFEQTEIGARGVAMGRAYSPIADDASAIYWNPGGLGALEKPEILFTHSRPFVIEDLSLNFAGVAWPTAPATVWAAWSRLGLTDVMSEDLFYFGAARRAEIADGRFLSVGASLKLARVDFQGEVATGAGVGTEIAGQTKAAADLGVHVRWSPRLMAGWVVRNVGEPSFDFVPGGGATRLRAVHEGGVAYQWHPQSRISLALVEGSERKRTPVLGTEIRFYDVFDLRLGIGDLKFYGGVGVRTERLRVDASFVTHNTLGISTMASVSVPLGSRP